MRQRPGTAMGDSAWVEWDSHTISEPGSNRPRNQSCVNLSSLSEVAEGRRQPVTPRQEASGHAAPQQPKPGEIITNRLGMKLVYISPGKFTMGSPIEEKERGDDEQAHEVEIDHSADQALEVARFQAGGGDGMIDRWILSDLQLLVRKAHEALRSYNVMAFCLEAEQFIDDRSSCRGTLAAAMIEWRKRNAMYQTSTEQRVASKMAEYSLQGCQQGVAMQ